MIRLERFAPQAARDLEEAAAWIADNAGGPDVARRLVAAAIRGAEQIAQRPQIGHRRLELLPDPFRFRRTAGFAYLLVYNADRTPPRILRVLHMARDLGPLLADLPSEPNALPGS